MKRIMFMMCLLFLCMFTSCKSASHIKDTNGDDDYSLCIVTDSDIINGRNSISSSSFRSQKNNKYKLSVGKFSGVNTVFKGTTNNQTILLTMDATVSSGNLRLVVMSNNEIKFDIKINTVDTYEIPGDFNEYKIVVAGESAKFKLDFELNYK